MKKNFSIFSLLVLLFSTFAPTFTYANTGENTVDPEENSIPQVDDFNTPESEPAATVENTVSTEENDNGEEKDNNTDAQEWVQEKSEKTEDDITMWNDSGDVESNNWLNEITNIQAMSPSITTASTDTQCFYYTIVDWVLTWIVPNYEANGCNSITSITIPSSATAIGAYAWFWEIPNYITEIVVPDSVTRLENGAFYKLAGSVSISLWTWINYIWEQAFKWEDEIWKTISGISNLTNVTEIGDWAFLNAKIDEINIEFADNATIGQQAFQNATIDRVNFRNTTIIPRLAFQSAEIWELNITWKEWWAIITWQAFEQASIWTINLDVISNIEYLAFTHVKDVSAITITWVDDWVTIGDQAFRYIATSGDCEVSLYNVDTIGDWAFYDAENGPNFWNMSITFVWETASIGQQSFANISFNDVTLNNVKNVGWLCFQWVNINKLTINWNDEWVIIWENAFWSAYKYGYWTIKSSINHIELNNVTEIVKLAFQYVQNIELLKVNWTWDGAIIGNNAFEETTISSVDMNNIKSIWSGAFIRVSSNIDTLKIIWNENGLDIANYAFQTYSRSLSINNIQLENVSNIDKWAFQYVKNIGSMSLKWSWEGMIIWDNAFEWIAINGDITLSNVTKIGSWTFLWMSWMIDNLNIIWSNNGLIIENYAFQHPTYQAGTTTFGSINITNLNRIDDVAFMYIKWIWNLTIEWIGNDATIWQSVFQYVPYIGNITLNNIKEIKKWAFQNIWYNWNVWELKIVGNEENGLEILDQAFQNSKVEKIDLSNVKSIWRESFHNNTVLSWLKIEWYANWYTIWNHGFKDNTNLESVYLWEWVTNIGDLAFLNNKISSLYIGWSNTLTNIASSAFKQNNITELTLWDNITAWDYAFAENPNSSNLVVYLSTKNLNFWEMAFTYDIENPVTFVTELEVSEYADKIEQYHNAWINLIQWRRISFVNEWNTISSKIYREWIEYTIPTGVTRAWYELIWWSDGDSEELFDFVWSLVEENKTFNAMWKSLEDKAKESTSNVSYLNNTTVTVNDIEVVLSETPSVDLATAPDNSEKSQKEIEVQAESNKEVEYEWWVEVFVELTVAQTKEKIDWTAKFSVPVAVKVPVSSSNDTVKVKVKHKGEEFGYKGLTRNPAVECVDWEAVSDQYNWEDIRVTRNNGEAYATIYTCSASTFVAYTEKNKVYPAAWGGRRIDSNTTNSTEQEHNSADTRNTKTTIKLDKALQERTLTRWEVAVMTNILLEVFPQLVEGKKTIDDVTNACNNYVDEQKFTRQEKKAVARLCKLSIMWVDTENKPLEEFKVKELVKNNEFANVIDKSISTYNEKDLATVKDALKKLETDEENVVFWTLFDLFMTIKDILN